MNKTFKLIFCAAVSCAVSLSFTACSDDDDPEVVDIPALDVEPEASSDALTMSSESLPFVGRWAGKGPSDNTKSYSVVSGTWQFHNDGTYEWYIPGDDGKDALTMSGKWSYAAGTLKIESDCAWEWTGVTFDETGAWTGTAGTDADLYTYTRKTDKKLTPGLVKVLNYKSGGFTLRDTVKNYKLCNEAIKYGVCYAKDDADVTDMSTWTKVYAEGIYKKGSTRGIYDLELNGLDNDSKYYLCGFVEREDGTVAYGTLYRAICVAPPANTVCMGDTTFWYTGAMETLYTADEAAAALASIGGALPTEAEKNSLASSVTYTLENGRIVLKSNLTGNTLSYAAVNRSNTYMTNDFWCEGTNGFYFYKSTIGEGMGKTPEYQSRAALQPVIKKAVTWEEPVEE